jgi:hypothetical protein
LRHFKGTHNAQDFTNTAWAFAKVEMKPEGWMVALAWRAQEVVKVFEAQDVANMAWAFAKMEMKPEGLMAALAWRAQEMMGELNAKAQALRAYKAQAQGSSSTSL